MVREWLNHWKLYKDLDLQVWGTLKESAQRCQNILRHCWNCQGKRMMGTHHHPPMTVHITKGELRQDLIARIAPKTTKRGINSLNIIEFILITSMLMMSRNHGIENHIVFLVCITMWLLSARREWKREREWGMKGLLHIKE